MLKCILYFIAAAIPGFVILIIIAWKNKMLKQLQNTKKNPSIHDIVQQYLKRNGYEGLCGDECGCSIDDLFPCSGLNMPGDVINCQAGYKHLCDGKCEYSEYGCHEHFTLERERNES